jgi:hypothetical protein
MSTATSTPAPHSPAPGYAYGSPQLARAPYTTAELAALQKALLFTEEDVEALRRSKENRTDGVDRVPQVNFRYLPALTIPITTTLKPFLARKGASAEEVERMHAAWVKSVLMQAILWSHPHVKEGEF